jgi:hypothetical protein
MLAQLPMEILLLLLVGRIYLKLAAFRLVVRY